MKKRALLSVSDKTGIVEFARQLEELGYEVVSTGGTARTLQENGIAVTGISDVTGFPECLDGRVKTLHPAVHAGILAMRSNPEHMAQLEKLGITPIDVVAINLYPFKQTILKDGVTLEEAIENIDIGGPTMIRAAAKNWQDVAVIVDPADYDSVIEGLKAGELSRETKFRLAAKVFEHTAAYDALISNYLRKQMGADPFPEELTLTFEKVQQMRYGENPHQNGAFYREIGKATNTLAAAKQLHGKELSYNNINDANGALDILKEFGTEKPCAVAVKHTNPCGVGIGETIHEAYLNAYNSDPVSIYGGIVALNRKVDMETAEELAKIFLEIIIAPGFDEDAYERLAKKKNIRLMELPDCAKPNAIVLAKDSATVGVGPGQTNRVTALDLAIRYAGDKAEGSVMASDAFFPFSDCVELAAKHGITAIIQPGGSIRDEDSIKACDEAGIAMVFTGTRHFKH